MEGRPGVGVLGRLDERLADELELELMARLMFLARRR